MNSRKTLNVLSVLSVLIIVGAAVLAWSVNASRQTATHAATQLATLTETFNNDTYIFTRLPGTGPSGQDASIDTGPFTMQENGQTLGTLEAKVVVGNAVRGPIGNYIYTVQMLSTVPGLNFSSSALDYPDLNISQFGDPAEFAESPYGQEAVKYSNLNYKIFTPDAVKDPTGNSTFFRNSSGAFATGAGAFTNMKKLVDMQGTAYQNMLDWVNQPKPPTAGQRAASTTPLSFHKAARPEDVPKLLRNFSVAGLALGTIGSLLNSWCGQDFCAPGKRQVERILTAVGAMLAEASTWILVVSGWSLLGAHIAAQRNQQHNMQPFVAAAAQAFRDVMEGTPYASARQNIEGDIEMGDPMMYQRFNNEL
jgi:hypothetical protein